jgi:hypothetical protein
MRQSEDRKEDAKDQCSADDQPFSVHFEIWASILATSDISRSTCAHLTPLKKTVTRNCTAKAAKSSRIQVVRSRFWSVSVSSWERMTMTASSKFVRSCSGMGLAFYKNSAFVGEFNPYHNHADKRQSADEAI